MRPRLALSILALPLLILAACDSSGTEDDPFDPLSVALARTYAEVPAFGGLTFEGDRLVVYTLGDDPSAAAEIRARLGRLPSQDATDSGYDVRARSARGNGSVELASQIQAAVRTDLGVEAIFNQSNGYVRVSTPTIDTARGAIRAIGEAGIQFDDVLVHVESRYQYQQ